MAKEDIRAKAMSRAAKVEAKDQRACLKARGLAKALKEDSPPLKARQFFNYRRRLRAHPPLRPPVLPTLLAIAAIRRAITNLSVPNGSPFDPPPRISKHDSRRHVLA